VRTYSQTVEYLFEQLPMFQRVGAAAFKKDLSNTINICQALGNPEKKFRSIHIAGTNGKGSVTHILASILQEAGLKVGCYISPHYKDFRERIKINGQLIEESAVVEFVEKNQSLIQTVKPSFFEITVAMAFDYFAAQKVDVAVIETGMGGRLDSTNVIMPELSVITNIAFDHQQFLGNTLPLIAGEKAGIIKPHVPVIIGEFQEEIEAVFREKAISTKSKIYYSNEICSISEFESNYEQSSFQILINEKTHQFTSDLCGGYQKKNLQTAIAAALTISDKFNLTQKHIEKGIQNVRKNTYFLGRFMKLQDSPLCIADSAHNEAGLKELIDEIDKIDYRNLHFVYGTVNDKDLSKILPLLPKHAFYYLCKPDIPRGLNEAVLKTTVDTYGLTSEAYSSVKKAFDAALGQANENDLIIVSGSIFVVAEII
jgi:dihydrofolate synthase / folylpolyglutamate synthase